MMLYLILNIVSISIPFIFSFHPRIQFYKRFPAVLPALGISAAIYLAWDVPFTVQGVWGFNEDYILGYNILGLPIEEWLFFICIPYASVFTHYTLTKLYPSLRLSEKITKYVTWSLMGLLLVVSLCQIDRAYTVVNGLLSLTILIITIWKKPQVLHSFYLTFLVVLIPFFIVNGILTGSFIEGEVVWYNNAENLGIRLFTIPVEDIFYAFGMILLTVLLTEIFTKNENLVIPS